MTVKQLFDKKIIWFNPPLNNKGVEDFVYQLKNWVQFNLEGYELKSDLWAVNSEITNFLRSWSVDADLYEYCFYIRFSPDGISYYNGPESDYEDAVHRYRERVEEEGYTPIPQEEFQIDYDETSGFFDKLNESDDLGWVKDVISQTPIPKRILINNKRYGIPDKKGYNENWRKIKGWTGWYKVLGTDKHLGEECFIVRLSPDYPRVFIPISDFTDDELQDAYKRFMSESKEYSNVSHLINKKIWFDYPTEREDIEKVNQFFIDNGFRGLESDNIDEFEDFIYDNDVAYFKLTQHTSPLFTDEERRPYVDYFSLDWPNPERLKNDPSFIYYQDILNMSDTTLDILSNLNESVEEPQPKVGDYLYCHKEVVMEDDGSKETTVGKFYPIIKVLNRDMLEIINDSKTTHQFSTDPKDDGYYGIWFQLVPKEHKQEFDSFNTESIFKNLNESFEMSRDVDYTGLQFTFDNNGVVYTLTKRCVNRQGIPGYMVEWQPPKKTKRNRIFTHQHCYSFWAISSYFKDGTWVPISNANTEDIFNQLD